MPRARLPLLMTILGAICIALAAAIIINTPAAQPQPTAVPATAIAPLIVEVAASPLVYDWAAAQAKLFNAEGRQLNGQPLLIRLVSQDDLEVWQPTSTWLTGGQPAGWIAEADYALVYAAENKLAYTNLVPSLAKTVLVWGVFSTRAEALASENNELDWPTFQRAADIGNWVNLGGDAGWGYVKPAFARPNRYSSGFAVLLSGAAAYYKSSSLSLAQIEADEFRVWVRPLIDTVPNFIPLVDSPAAAMAQSGLGRADFGLLPESQWLLVYGLLKTHQPIQFSYPAYQMPFNFPLAVWAEASPTQREAVNLFAAYLQSADAQANLLAYGLRPSNKIIEGGQAKLFDAASEAGIMLTLPEATPFTMPTRQAALSLLDWFASARKAP
jgi:hypothetical protein